MTPFTPAFLAGLNAGLAAPVSLYSPTPSYAIDVQAYSFEAAIAIVGSLVSKAAQQERPVVRR